MSNYFIKNGYEINPINVTNDTVSDTNYWDKKRNLAAEMYQFPVYKFVSKFCQKNSIKKIIDIGCGVGRKLEYLNQKNSNLKIIGIDQKDPIAYCNENYNFGEWHADDFENSTLSQDIKSSLILSSDVIEHLIDPDLLLNYIKSKLLPGGTVILSTPERDLFRGKDCTNSPNKHHIREWNFKEFEQYLESRDFEIIDHFVQYPVKTKLNMIFFNEIIMRFIGRKPLKYNQVVVARFK